MTSIEQPMILGEGILTWPPAERDLGRFGTVCLRTPNTNQFARFDNALDGAVVRLSFTVTYVRAVTMAPPTRLGISEVGQPGIGEEINLGIGALFTVDLEEYGPIAIGVLPTEQRLRPDQWLDVTSLFRAANQLGHLTAHPFRGHSRPSPNPAPA
jgi:hypothetical protein